MDEVLFRLAYLLQTIKKEEQAREFFLRLIKDYPNSKYVPDAYLSFAQFYFDKGEMDAAKKFYEKVEQFPKSPVYGYAVYKKGWCYINLGDFKTALGTFVDVIRLAQSGKAGGNKLANQALEREAKKDVVKAYARTPGAGPDKAWEFFTRVGGDFAPKMMEGLAELYWEQGMFGDSTKVYHKMMVLNPESPRLCEWQNKVVRNTLSAGTKRDQVQEVNRLGIAYDRVKASTAAKKDLVDECRNAFHDISKELALVWHKEAQRTKNPDTYVLVRYVYKDYLDRFAKEKGALDMAFYYAEVLWTTQMWREAAEQYSKVVELDPKGKWVKDAAYAAVLAWKNALNIDDQGQGPDKQGDNTKDFKPQPIPEYQKKMIAAFDTYIRYVPDAPELVTIKYRKARIYYDYNHFDDAVPLFQNIVDQHSDHELAEYSANLMLDSLNIQGEKIKLPGKTREALKLGRQVHGHARADEERGVRQEHGQPQGRRSGHRGQAIRGEGQLQGVRPLDAGRGRVDARSPETRRAALRLGRLLPERAPHRSGGRRSQRAHQAPIPPTRWPRRRCSRWPPATTRSPFIARRRSATSSSPPSSRVSGRRPTPSTTLTSSGSACASTIRPSRT